MKINYEKAGVFVLGGLTIVLLTLVMKAPAGNQPLEANLSRNTPNFLGGFVGNAPDHVLVGYQPNVDPKEKEKFLTRNKTKDIGGIAAIDVRSVAVPPSFTPESFIEHLMKSEGRVLEFAEPDALLAPSFIPNDPDYSSQWHHSTIGSPAAWDSTSGANTVIAIVDTGVDGTHSDLAPHLVSGWNFYNNNTDTADVFGHGTAVAGVAAAVGDNAVEVAGVAYGSSIMPLRVSDQNGNASLSTIAGAITWAADHGIKVINVSYPIGGSSAISRAARYAQKKNGLIISAEGNSGAFSGYAGNPAIINVSATDNYDLFATWSTFGADVDLSAPGQAILTTIRGGGTNLYSGTSFSAPIVSGVAALVWSVNPLFTADDVAKILSNSTLDLGAAGWDEKYGWGRVDAAAAVDLAKITKPSSSAGPRVK